MTAPELSPEERIRHEAFFVASEFNALTAQIEVDQ